MPRRIAWVYASAVVGYHVIALLAFLPWFFSWTGVILTVAGCYVFGTLGITLCYHRLLAHRGFVCPKWLEHSFALLGVCCLQDTPAHWVAVHRRHHEHADERPDPHSPLVSFFWGHMGWLLVVNDDLGRLANFERYAKDILRDPFYKELERDSRWIAVIVLSWFVFFAAGFFGKLAGGGSLMHAVQFGSSVLLWGVFVRTVLLWHITWSVNSVTHLWGYRNYATDEESRNNIFVSVLTNGEGWHNNHHADSRSARHGHRWWELDVTYLTIVFITAIGLARDVIKPNPRLAILPAGARLVTRGHGAIGSE
ncbi:MAG TPA: fatty acid desaturase [Dongiaceae bacterium]|nr:fatty acid desaturase [Dongiaceae bacterium]